MREVPPREPSDQMGSHREERSRAWPQEIAAGMLFALAAGAIMWWMRGTCPGVPDPDTFYHLRHAAEYARRGVFYADFPWLPYSALGRYRADPGYGFHVLLIPFAGLRDPAAAASHSSVALAVVAMLATHVALRRHRLAYAYLWPFVAAFASAPMVWTMFQTRPQTLSMGLVALLFSASVAGSPALGLGASFFLSFVHLNAALLACAVVAPTVLVRWAVARRAEPAVWAATVVGLLLGWAARPNPLGAARVEWVQVVMHETVRAGRLPVLFGREWLPLTFPALGAFGYFLLLWLGLAVAVAACWRSRVARASAGDRVFLCSSLLLSWLFFAASLVATKRFTPFWVICAVLFCAQAFTILVVGLTDPAQPRALGAGRVLGHAVVLALMAAMAISSAREHLAGGKWVGIPPHRMRAVAGWLREHARPGEVVFNVHWSHFPELYYWDPDARYVSGLDPIFLYEYRPSLYWKLHHLMTGRATTHTWAGPSPGSSLQEPLARVMREELHASSLVLDRALDRALDLALRGDPEFLLVYDDPSFAVYSLRGQRTPQQAEAARPAPGRQVGSDGERRTTGMQRR